MTFGEFIDNLNKFFSRIKTIVVLFLLLLFAFSLIKHGYNRHETNELVKKITGLDIQNDLLKKEIKERTIQIKAYRDSISEIQAQIAMQEQTIQKNSDVITGLRRENRRLKDQAINTPKDEIYEFLIIEAYPDTGKKEFAFSEGQIREIHLDYIDNISCQSIVSAQDTLINNLIVQIDNKDSQIEYLENSLSLQQQNVKAYSRVMSNQEEIIDRKDEIIKKEKKGKTFWKIIAGIAIVVAAGASM